MKEKQEQRYFIPDTFSVGLLSSSSAIANAKADGRLFVQPSVSDFGFVTCRYEYKQWLSPGVFERLTGGYKPSNQRDRAIQLKKAVTGAVNEIRNDPASGFRLVSWRSNPYGFRSMDYDRSGDIVLEDPRGFLVAVTEDSFFRTLSMAGAGMSQGALDGEYAYGWRKSDRVMTLVPASYAEYRSWKAESDEQAKMAESGTAYLSGKKLEPGHVYRAANVMGGDWMYVGRFDTYSPNCHLAAFDAGGKYNVAKFAEAESGQLRQKWRVVWPTTHGKMVFYSMSPRPQQYAVRTSADRIFFSEVTPAPDGTFVGADGLVYQMYDGSGPVTYKRVMDDMSGSPAFNMVDFGREPDLPSLPASALEYYFGDADCGRESFMFPFSRQYYPCAFRNQSGEWIKISKYNGRRLGSGLAEYKIFRNLPIMRGYGMHGVVTGPLTVASLCATLNLAYPAYRFINGREVRPEHAVAFVPIKITNAARLLY